MKKLLTLTLALAVLATFSGLATAGTTVKGGKSNSDNRVAADNTASKLLTGKVTQVNVKANTFIVTSKDKSVTFSAAKLSKLPTVGEIVDITYTENPDGGPLKASNLNLSKSNIN